METRLEGRAPDRFVRGFTLVELLVVLTLMAMLLAISLPRYMGSTETAKEKVRAQNMETLRDAIDQFRGDQGRYPMSLAELVDRRYLRRVPLDPLSNSTSWRLIPPSSGGEPGVYDVAPPSEGDPAKGGSTAAESAPIGANTPSAQ